MHVEVQLKIRLHLTRRCNWDEGDCTSRFEGGAESATHPCARYCRIGYGRERDASLRKIASFLPLALVLEGRV